MIIRMPVSKLCCMLHNSFVIFAIGGQLPFYTLNDKQVKEVYLTTFWVSGLVLNMFHSLLYLYSEQTYGVGVRTLFFLIPLTIFSLLYLSSPWLIHSIPGSLYLPLSFTPLSISSLTPFPLTTIFVVLYAAIFLKLILFILKETKTAWVGTGQKRGEG